MLYAPYKNEKLANQLANTIKLQAHELNDARDLDPLMERIGDARFVLLGEASHGTHEYYLWRARISQRLIEEKGFSFVAVEGDWPDCYRLNRYVKGYIDAGGSARDVLHAFNRWPTCMWANREIEAFAEWMRQRNEGLVLNQKVGFYGLDVYSLWESIEAIKKYLEKRDKNTWEAAEQALHCFDAFGGDEGSAYARATHLTPASCEEEVIQLLAQIRQSMPSFDTDREAVFSTEQNALIALHAEQYYRSMISGGAQSWNIRDNHMMQTLNRLTTFHGANSKAIVWAHNTHIGDARATDMTRQGMFNLGELARDANKPEDVVLVGFGSYKGSVIASRRWAGEMKEMQLPGAPAGTWENILHNTGIKNGLFIMNSLDNELASKHVEHRAVGVVYQPELEQYGNYVPSKIAQRYDAFIFMDETRALHPLHINVSTHEMPETYPWGV
jgi:erythromycin esterase-like protein